MDFKTEKTLVIGGLLAAMGLFILSSQFFGFTSAAWSLFLAAQGAVTMVLSLRDRSQKWLLFTTYALWVAAVTLFLAYSASRSDTWFSMVLPAWVQIDELIAPFLIAAMAAPAWIGYFKNKNRGFLIAAYSFSILLLVVLAAFYTSGEYILTLILFAAAVPMVFSFFKNKNLFLLLSGSVLIILATSYSVGVWLEETIHSSNAMIYALGGGGIVSGLAFFALLPQIKKEAPHAVVQSMIIAAIFIVLGGIMLLSVNVDISIRTIYLLLGSIGLLTGAWFLIDRSQTWLGIASYTMFFIIGIIYISFGYPNKTDPAQYQYSRYVAPFIFGSLGVPFLLAFFRNSSRKWALITGYSCCIFAGFLLLTFSSFLDGNLIAPYILFAIGLPFITAFIRSKASWALIPGYASLSLGLALLLGSIIREATSLEPAFYYTAAGFLVLSGLGMQVLRPKFNQHLEAG